VGAVGMGHSSTLRPTVDGECSADRDWSVKSRRERACDTVARANNGGSSGSRCRANKPVTVGTKSEHGSAAFFAPESSLSVMKLSSGSGAVLPAARGPQGCAGRCCRRRAFGSAACP
jgi:hypothetical protein